MKDCLLVIDTNVFYTFIKESSYSDDYESCMSLLFNVLAFCEHKICMNDFINEEYNRFKKIAEKSPCSIYFNPWYKEMVKRHKFKTIHPYPHIKPKIHRKDLKFYQTAYNTIDKLLITCEQKHHNIKKDIYDNFNIEILTINEANDRIIKNHSEISE